MSAPRVTSSQLATALRKLPIIIPTPTMTLTATVSAATATALRLSERRTARGAIRPLTPKSRPVNGVRPRSSRFSASGASSAPPMMKAVSAMKARRMLSPGRRSSA